MRPKARAALKRVQKNYCFSRGFVIHWHLQKFLLFFRFIVVLFWCFTERRDAHAIGEVNVYLINVLIDWSLLLLMNKVWLTCFAFFFLAS